MPEPEKPQAWGRTGDLVRTFKAVNDPNAPPWSIRFVGAIAALAILLAGAGALWYAARPNHDAAAPGEFAAATVQDNGDGTYTDYVGLVPTAVPQAVDARAVEDALGTWRGAHPDVQVLKETPVYQGGQLVGYHVTYRR